MSRIEALQNLVVALIFQKTLDQKASVVPQASRVFACLNAVAASQADLGLDPQADRERVHEIVKLEARFVFDGGAYTSTSPAVLLNGISQAQLARMLGVSVPTDSR